MTERDRPRAEPGADPGDPDEVVRALLAEARVDEPMPREVADRLDEALADAPAPARPGDGRAAVVRLRRRLRHRLVGGLVAAAVVVLGAGALVAQLDRSGGSSDSSAVGSSASRAEDGGGSALAQPQPPAGDRATTSKAAPQDLSGRRARLPALRSAELAADVRALVAAVPGATSTGAESAPADGLRSPRAGTPGSACTRPEAAGSGADLREVSLDGRLATLLVDPPGASPRRATAYSCDGAHELATTVLSR